MGKKVLLGLYKPHTMGKDHQSKISLHSFRIITGNVK